MEDYKQRQSCIFCFQGSKAEFEICDNLLIYSVLGNFLIASNNHCTTQSVDQPLTIGDHQMYIDKGAEQVSLLLWYKVSQKSVSCFSDKDDVADDANNDHDDHVDDDDYEDDDLC